MLISLKFKNHTFINRLNYLLMNPFLFHSLNTNIRHYFTEVKIIDKRRRSKQILGFSIPSEYAPIKFT